MAVLGVGMGLMISQLGNVVQSCANPRCCPWQAGRLAKAIHVLQTHETQGWEKLSDATGTGVATLACRVSQPFGFPSGRSSEA